jgi:hypothetical protein
MLLSSIKVGAKWITSLFFFFFLIMTVRRANCDISDYKCW